MKIAHVKLSWTRSPSNDIKRQIITVTGNGQTIFTSEVGPEVENVTIQVKASTVCVASVVTLDNDGLVASSSPYNFTIYDMEVPLPATNLFHEIVGITEEPETPPVPTPTV